MYLIFRKVDKEILYICDTEEQLQNEVTACLENEPGPEEDYVVVDDPRLIVIPNGMIPQLEDDGTVILVDNPKKIQRDIEKAELGRKLSAALPTLSADEIRRMVR